MSDDGGVVAAKMLEREGNIGFDPAKVARIALESAVSVASVLLLTAVTMTEIPEEERRPSLSSEMTT